jgi:GTP cyclohydrolase I
MLESNDIELLPDTQAGLESRNLAVNGAGISGLKLPLEIVDVDGQTRQTVAVAEAAVRVAADERGTHMSRLVEAVDHLGPRLELGFLRMHHVAMLLRLASSYGELTLRFPWFVSKQAPASGLKSWLDVEALYRVEGKDRGKPVMTQVLRVPVTTLCPCSKSISRYGAHNQRSYVTVALRTSSPVAIGPLVARIEAQASCAI